MSIVWHRLGKKHPLVQQLDRVSREQCRNACRRRRLSDSRGAEGMQELEAERAQLAEARAALERSLRAALAEAVTARPSTSLSAARGRLANVLAGGPAIRVRQGDSSAG